jgi:hypothetical protein
MPGKPINRFDALGALPTSGRVHAEISQVELSVQQLGMPAAHHFRWVRQPEAVLDQFERWVRGRRQFDRSNT